MVAWASSLTCLLALEFAFLDDPLMRLVGVLDTILTIIVFGPSYRLQA